MHVLKSRQAVAKRLVLPTLHLASALAGMAMFANFSGRKLVVAALATVLATVVLGGDARAQTVVFRETFGSAAGQLPTAVSDADYPYNDAGCRNGHIQTTVPGGYTSDPGSTAYLYHNTAACGFPVNPRVWYNVVPIPVQPNSTYRFVHQAWNNGATNKARLTQTVETSSGVVIPATLTSNPPLSSTGWGEHFVEFTTDASTTSVTLAIRNSFRQAGGNDFRLDGIVLYDITPRLTLIKAVTNDNGGTAMATDFTLTATGPTPISGVSGNAAVTNVAVDAGAYVLGEVGVPGYTAGTYSCAINGAAASSGNDLVLAVGDEAVCTVVNNDEAARLTLRKTVTNDNGGTAQASDFTLTATGPETISGATGTATVTNADVPAGSYVLSETDLPGYAAGDYSCVVNGAAAVVGDNLTLALGDEAVCTVENDDEPATLTLVKTVTNDNGGVATAANFTLTATGPTLISGITGAPAVTAAAVSAGTYALRETNMPGYSGSDYACVVNGGAAVSGNTLTLAGGDDAVCTIANDDQAASLTLVKALINDDGGIAVAADFTLSATGPVTISGVTGAATVTAASVPAGAYVLSETNRPGYAGSAYTCIINGGAPTVSDALTLVSGDAAICTVVNNDIAPAVTIRKELTGESMVADQVPEPGETLTYTITLTNTGGTAIGYSVTDVLDSNVNFVSASDGGAAGGVGVIWSGLTVPAQVGVVPGEMTLTVDVQVNGVLTPGAVVTNLAKETGKPDPACPSNQCVQIPDPAHITIAKTLVSESGVLPGVAEPGEFLTYRIRLTNNGGAELNYSVTDKLDPNTTFDSVDNGGALIAGNVEWSGLTVPPYSAGAPGALDLSVRVAVNATLPAGTAKVSNIAFETGMPEPVCPSAQCVETQTAPAITIKKQLTGESGTRAGTAEPGETLTYQITLTNTGGPETDYAVTDRLDANVSLVNASDGGVLNGSDVNWSVLTVPAQVGATPGTRVLTVRTKAASPLPAGLTQVSNVAFQTGQPEPVCPSAQCVELPTPPNVTIKKTLVGEDGSLAGIAEPGETLTYTITLTNTGGAATDYAVTDKLDPNVAFDDADNGGVEAAGNVVWAGLVVPQQMGATPGVLILTVSTRVNGPLDAGVSKIGNVAYETGEPVPSCPSAQCVSLPTPPAITIAKVLTSESGSRAGVAEPGETLTYTVTLTNAGGAATGYAGTDRLDANVTFANASDGGVLSGGDVNWTGLSLPAQVGATPATRTLIVRTKVKDPLPSGVANISNLAFEAGQTEPVCPSVQCVDIPTPSVVTLEKKLTNESDAVNGIAQPGETLTYTITLTNAGGTDFAGYKLTENVPLGATLTSVTGAAGFGSSVTGPGTLDLVVPVVAANGTAKMTVEFQVDDPLPVGVLAIGNSVSGGNVAPDCTTCSVVTPTPPRLSVEKLLTGESVTVNSEAEPGEVLTYTITLTNTGGSDFSDFDLTENVPAGATLTAVSGATGFGSALAGPATLGLRVATVPANDEAVVTVAFTVASPLVDGVANIVNTVSGGDIPPDCTICTVTTPTTSKVTVEKALTDESDTLDAMAQPGEVLTYTITLTNAGGSPFTGFDFTENVPAGATLTSVTGATGFGSPIAGPGTVALAVATVPAEDSATVTVTFTVDDPIADGIETIANTISGGDIDPACATCSVTTLTAPKVTVVKQLTDESTTADGVAEPGEVLTYTITLTNAGGADFTDFEFTEKVPAGATLTAVTGATGFTSSVAGPGTLDLKVPSVPLGAAATVTVAFTVDGSLEASVKAIANTISGGDIDPDCEDCSVTTPTADPLLELEKTGSYEDTDGSGGPTPGDTLTYTFVVTNTGNLILDSINPIDAGPTFNGRPGTGSLSAIAPSPLTLALNETETFTATYTLSQDDIDNATGIADGVRNTALARGYRNGSVVPSNAVDSDDSVSLLALPAAAPSDITVAKQAGLRFIRIGEKAPYTITVTNNAAANVSGMTITDVMPSGFRFVEGSATVDGVEVTPVVNGRNVVFGNLSLPGNGTTVIRLQTMALSSAGPGKHVNSAIATDENGDKLALEAKATVEILAEPVFDCGEIIGKVFDDKNRNGYQDEGEPGLPGVRLATVNGVLVTTDAHGRFHVACADLPKQRIGSNFIMKLDTRTLPTGYGLTTENPRVVRLTAGKMTKLNFGAAIGRVVRLDLEDAAFVPGRAELRPEWQKGLEQLVEMLGKERSILRVGYVNAGSDKALAAQRMRALEKDIARRWRAAGHRTPLDVETRVEAGK